MSVSIKTSSNFDKEAKKLNRKYKSFADDYFELLETLDKSPQSGTQLGGGLRKVRMKITSKGKGKSGGARVITYMVILSDISTELLLLKIYDKSDLSTIETKELKALVKELGL